MTNKFNKVKTPCFIIDKTKLDDNIKNINIGRCIFNKSIIGYSVKTNSLLWLLNYFINNTDFYLEVVSPEEYEYVLSTGIDPRRIIFNGPCKDFQTINYALYNHSIVNIDTYRDLLNVKNIKFKANIGIRVNVTNNSNEKNLEKFGYEESRFGFSYQNGDLENIIKQLNNHENIKFSGLHFHLNNKKREVDNYILIAKLASEIINKYNLKLDYIDFGGGYKGGYGVDFINYTTAIYNNLNINNKDDITYIFEPGAAVIATPISYLTRVIDIRDINGKKYVLIDGGRTHIDPTMSSKKYKYNIFSEKNDIENTKQIIIGFSCMENDRIIELVNSKALSIGDMIEFENLGAYTMTLLPCFIKGYPNIYLIDNDNYVIIREKKDILNILGENNERVYKKIK